MIASGEEFVNRPGLNALIAAARRNVRLATAARIVAAAKRAKRRRKGSK
jgi:hypothetical protein